MATIMRSIFTLCLLSMCSSITFGQNWSMLYRSPHRNNVSDAGNLPVDFDVRTGKNIKWAAKLGSQSYGSPVVAHGQIYIGTNNGNGYLNRFPPNVDLGCLLCFRQSDGRFLWQYSATKLPTGRVHDWPLQGICSVPLIEDRKMWFVSNQGKIVCLDTIGFYDGEDNGTPITTSTSDLLFKATPKLSSNAYTPKTSLSRLQNRTILALTTDVREVRMSSKAVPQPNKQAWTIEVRKFLRETRKWTVKSRLELTPNKGGFELVQKKERESVVIDQLESDMTLPLDRGHIGTALRRLLKNKGIAVDEKGTVEVVEKGSEWKFHGRYQKHEGAYTLKLRLGVLSCHHSLTPENRLPEADVIWEYDMMAELGVSQHNMATCAPAAYGDVLFINTSNGLDVSHINLPAPDAPTFIALNKNTGELLWSDNPVGKNILHGQWSCPAVGVFNGVAQVIFPAGDGWVYSYRADEWQDGKPILLWKFDGNPKTSKWILGGSGTRNNIIASPVIHDRKVYFVMGQDPEHGEGLGGLWCVDPTRRGDISSELVVDKDNNPVPPRRIQAVDNTAGEKVIPNPNSGVVWKFDIQDANDDGEIDYEEEMHRSLGSPVIADGLLYLGDFSGIVYCLDAKTGKIHWTYDAFSPCWGTALIADGKVYLGDEDGDLMIFEHSRTKKLINEVYMEDSVKMTPIAIGETLYVATLRTLYAIRKDRTVP